MGKKGEKVFFFFAFKSQNPRKKDYVFSFVQPKYIYIYTYIDTYMWDCKLIINYVRRNSSQLQLDHNLHFRAPGIPFSLATESLSLKAPLLKPKDHIYTLHIYMYAPFQI